MRKIGITAHFMLLTARHPHLLHSPSHCKVMSELVNYFSSKLTHSLHRTLSPHERQEESLSFECDCCDGYVICVPFVAILDFVIVLAG